MDILSIFTDLGSSFGIISGPMNRMFDKSGHNFCRYRNSIQIIYFQINGIYIHEYMNIHPPPSPPPPINALATALDIFQLACLYDKKQTRMFWFWNLYFALDVHHVCFEFSQPTGPNIRPYGKI